jgi:hypothetical protein
MANQNSSPNRILLGQLISNGDCLYATAIARQIKLDFPGCHLTWAVSSLCRKTIEENPVIDEIWEIPLPDWSDGLLHASWSYFEDEALRRYEMGLYDFVFFTQIYPGNPHHFEGTVRPGIFLGYPGQITVPLQPTVVLRPEEVERVNFFALEHHLRDFEQVILFECSGKSGQTHVTPEFALQAAETIARIFEGRHAVILSSHYTFPRLQKGVIDGSVLSLREMAELTKHCSLLIGCSSGISTIATSSWAKPLPMIQMLTNRSAMFGSLAYDYCYFGLPTLHVIEMFDANIERLLNCFNSFLRQGWAKTRSVYHEELQISFAHYLSFIETYLLGTHDYYGFCISLQHTVHRFGWNPALNAILRRVAGKILGEAEVDREASPDQLLRRLMRPTRALSSASMSVTGRDPASIRPETCVLTLRRSEAELEQILGGVDGFVKGVPQSSELVSALLDLTAKDKIAFLQSKNPENRSFRLAGILALIQRADYFEARQQLVQWKQANLCWNSDLEEILGDLHWMQADHISALASYQQALGNRPVDAKLQQKIDRLFVRDKRPSVARKSEPQLRDLGLVFCPTERINSAAINRLMESRLQISRFYKLETASLTASKNDPSEWSLVDDMELQQTGYEWLFTRSKKANGCKKFLNAAVKWADRKGKRWVAFAALDTIVSAPLLRELQNRLVHDPAVLIIEKWDFSQTDSNRPGLILMRIDWWKRNRWRFLNRRLENVEWIAHYADTCSKLTDTVSLREPEHRILTAQALSSLLVAIASSKPKTNP